jgi:hypothetical protein
MRTLALATFLALVPLSSWATSIHVTWGYTPPTEPAVTGFRLYQEGNPVCSTDNSDAQDIDCDVTLVKDVTIYTLTAMFVDGTESPHSAPYAFDRNGRLLAPWGFARKR